MQGSRCTTSNSVKFGATVETVKTSSCHWKTWMEGRELYQDIVSRWWQGSGGLLQLVSVGGLLLKLKCWRAT